MNGTHLLPPATKLGQGNVFTGICDSVHRGVCLRACRDTTPQGPGNPPDQAPLPGPGTPREQSMLGDSSGKHPTGMQSCFILKCTHEADPECLG